MLIYLRFHNEPAERITSYIPDVDDIIEDHLPTQPEDEQEELPKITVVDAQKAVELLETFWLEQDGDALGFLKSVQQMKDKVGAIRTNLMVQPDLRDFFGRV
ncbi:unnamed protein product [Peronospora destructor]|uniref:Uncharacterized protein n=1 Tax=Peronospora destructor TaxID=86335 RepID=A0AAV0T1W7_9STRA|nr:unnamed protein product [Peronospora destructor]